MITGILIIVCVTCCIIAFGLGMETGKDYVIDEILKEIRIRRKMQAPTDILTEVIRVCYRIKEKGD